LGDIHADFQSVDRIMRRQPHVPAWLCVGDVGNDEGTYREVPAPLVWIKGNNESFDFVAAQQNGEKVPVHSLANLFYLPNAVPRQVAGVRVLGVGGTLAPTWYDTDPADLPHPRKGTMKATVLADKRRHFVRAEVERAKALGPGRIDVLLTHEAPRPFRVGRMDAGKSPINELIGALRPRLHLFGHHHRFAEMVIDGVRSIGLDLVSVSYLLIDTTTWEYEKKDS
jgi:Icc-related predicted phosphoesterase